MPRLAAIPARVPVMPPPGLPASRSRTSNGVRKRQNVPILVNDRLHQSPLDPVYHRELVAPVERPHRIEDRAAIGVILAQALFRRHARVERRAPATIDEMDVG